MTSSNESGTITVWMLGLVVALLFVGGFSLDLWRAFLERRELSGAVDAAAVAASSALDEAAFREGALPRLDPVAAEAVACTYLHQHTDPPASCDRIQAGVDLVVVTASRQVPLTLLKLLLPGLPPLTVEVSARVEPRVSAGTAAGRG